MSEGTTTTSIGIKKCNPMRNMTFTYVISLSVIASLSMVVHFMLDNIIAQQTDTAIVVNISGQQRMLSQRISLLTIEYLNTGSAQLKNEVVQALNTLHKNHQFLLQNHLVSLQNKQPSPLSDSMQNLYFRLPHQVDDKIKHFSELINQTLNLDIPIDVSKGIEYGKSQDRRFWQLAKTSLLDSLNLVVKQYESESLFKVNELRWAQQLVFWIILLTLLVEALFIFRPMVSRVTHYAERLKKEANFDYLTGLLNRRAFAILAANTVAECQRYEHPLSLLTLDIDHFKSVNDSYGHDAGDTALQYVSNIIKNTVRESDTVARFGGEEFVVLLPKTKAVDAQLLAEKIRQNIENSPLTLKNEMIKMTISCGVSRFDPLEASIDAMLKRADRALYQAKKRGRNQVCSV
jgi:diguanylate cyclase (GGDEF)-like protein